MLPNLGPLNSNVKKINCNMVQYGTVYKCLAQKKNLPDTLDGTFLRPVGYIIYILTQERAHKNERVRPFLDNKNKNKKPWRVIGPLTNHLSSHQQQKDFRCFKKRQWTRATALWQAAVPLFALSSCSSKTATTAAPTLRAPLFTSLQSLPVVVN